MKKLLALVFICLMITTVYSQPVHRRLTEVDKIANDYGLCIARTGMVPDMSAITKFGRNDTTTNAAFVGVWRLDRSFNFPTSALTMYVVSSSTADDAGSTGMTSVTISGLTVAWIEQSEIVELDGRTSVALSNTYFRINSATGVAFGSGAANAGVVSIISNQAITAGVPQDNTKIYASIGIGENEAIMSLYSVPDNNSAYITDLWLGRPAAVTNAMQYRLFKREFNATNQAWTLIYDGYVSQTDLYLPFPKPIRIPEKSDIKLEAKSSSGSQHSAGSFRITLVEER